jgi:hypothetical protein
VLAEGGLGEGVPYGAVGGSGARVEAGHGGRGRWEGKVGGRCANLGGNCDARGEGIEKCQYLLYKCIYTR